MRHDPPRMEELMGMVRDNPGFVLMDHLDALDWGDLTKYDNRLARSNYRSAVSSSLSALVKQGYLRSDTTQRPTRFYVCEEITPRRMKGHPCKIFVEHDGRTAPLADLCREHGIRRNTAYGRLKRGWSVEETLTAPPDKHRRHKHGN